MNNDIIYQVRKGINSLTVTVNHTCPKFNNENKFFDHILICNLHSLIALNLVGSTILALIKFIVRKSQPKNLSNK